MIHDKQYYSDALLDIERAKAKKGDVHAQYYLFEALTASNKRKDLIEAFFWGEQSAKNGYEMFALGDEYLQRGNLEKAFEWLSKASKKKHIPSIFALALMYHHGNYVAKDMKKAIELYNVCTKSDEYFETQSQAMNELAKIYLNGDGVAKDLKLAFSFYRKSARTNDEEGIDFMIKCVREGNDEALRCLQESAVKGSPIAKDFLKGVGLALKPESLGPLNLLTRLFSK